MALCIFNGYKDLANRANEDRMTRAATQRVLTGYRHATDYDAPDVLQIIDSGSGRPSAVAQR